MTHATFTFARVKALLTDHFALHHFPEPEDADLIADEACLHDLGFDDLDHVELIIACEEAFDVEISDAEAEQVRTIGDLVRILDAKIVERV